jgi:transposase-like protein
MTDPTIALLEYLRKIGADLDGNFLRESVQLLIELEAEDQIGAAKYERSPSRKAGRNS